MGIEYERKYKATPQSLDQLEAAMGQNATLIRMETAYYDTADGDFSARHWTLRRRLENERSVCTFKYPVDAIGRGEFEVECDNIQEGAEKLCKLSGQPELAGLAKKGLVQVCGARFTRTAIAVTVGASQLELALDRGVLLGGGKELPLFEAEAELKSGQTADVDRFGLYLQTAFGLEPESRSKFARAKALAKENCDV